MNHRAINLIAHAVLGVSIIGIGNATAPRIFAEESAKADEQARIFQRDQEKAIDGIRALFARTVEAAVTPDATHRLADLFVGEKSAPANDVRDDSSHLATIDEFNAEWRGKYHQDFHIIDNAMVFSDVTGNSLLNPPRGIASAGAGLPGGPLFRTATGVTQSTGGSTSGQPSSGNGAQTNQTKGNRPDALPDTLNANGTGPTSVSRMGAPNGTQAGTSDGDRMRKSDAEARNISAGRVGSTEVQPAAQSDHAAVAQAPAGAQTRPTDEERKDRRESSRIAAVSRPDREIYVHLQYVKNAPLVDVRLVREDISKFRFMSNGPIDLDRLASAIDNELRAVLSDKKDWPADIHEAQRLVTQHVLLAISQSISAPAPDLATSPGAHSPGEGKLEKSAGTDPTAGGPSGINR